LQAFQKASFASFIQKASFAKLHSQSFIIVETGVLQEAHRLAINKAD
jgi:hypothetical protein